MTAEGGPIAIELVHADEPVAAPEPGPATDDRPVFYYDLGSPACYLTAERIMAALPVVPEWEPVLGAQLGLAEPTPRTTSGSTPRSPTTACSRCGCRRAGRLTAELAMLVATYAKRGGKAVAYSLAAFRQAFAGGRDLERRGDGADRRRGLRDAPARRPEGRAAALDARGAAASRRAGHRGRGHRAPGDRHRQRHLLRRAGA